MDISSLFLPAAILKNFTITSSIELCDIKTREVFIEVHLEENNILPDGYNSMDYESKGFYPSKSIQDFPIRGKALYLCIKRRVWRHKSNRTTTIKSDYSFIAEGSKLTQELSDFLKGTDRHPSRYNK